MQNQRVNDLLQARQVQPVGPSKVQPTEQQKVADGDEFSAMLADRLSVSKHAKTRLQSREIQFDQAKWDRVLSGVDRAAQKGAKESLVMVDDVALVVSVRNRTVITAVDQQHLKENVFTNIDSAVIV